MPHCINGRHMQGARDFMNSLHFGTRSLVIFMTVFYILQLTLFDPSWTGYITINPYSVIAKGEVWRLVTSMFGHLGILHLVMNMMSLTFLGMTLETTIGTLSFFYHIVIFGIAANLVYVGIAYMMAFGGDGSLVVSQALGFSGVLFVLIVIDVDLSGGDQRSIFGLFAVPAWLYPWVMLVFMSMLMPNVSFIGHFSGIVVGYMYKWHLLSWLAPSARTFSRIESRICSCCTTTGGYVRADSVHDAQNFQPFAFFQHFYRDTPDGGGPAQPAFNGTPHTLGTETVVVEVAPEDPEAPRGSDTDSL